jgi:hypothetical protein
MARCDQGYLCDVCGDEVESIRESDLYLRYVTGAIAAQQLLATPERHIRCNPVQAQFIEHADFEPITVEGDFDKRVYPEADRMARVDLLTRGWLRLQEIAQLPEPIPLPDYPLTEYRKSRG